MENLAASAKKRKQPEANSEAVYTEVKHQDLASKKQRAVAWKYDVFVSFRGEDIRKSFIDHLFKDFKQNGIHAFRDNIALPRGEEISPQLYNAIENSRILMVIFSKNYASSSWCLRELVKILNLKQMEKAHHEVRILFYDVKPEVVRKQTENYAEAFAKHQVSNRAEVDEWKRALTMAASLSGWDLNDMTNGYESKFIDCISKDIRKTLCDVPLHVGENLVGVDARLSKLNLVHFIGSSKVNMIGICGISGIGKTTIAKAIYNSMYAYFEGSCFCEDVKGVTERQGLPQVQKQFINKIMKTEDVKISHISEGIMLIKKKVACEPIFLVMDNVDHHEQLEALAGSHDWFCPGSLIIFTGKDKQLLRSHRVDTIYDVEFLDDREDIQLFCLYAFGQTYPTQDFKELSYEVVKCLQGHPLALKVVGNALFGKSTRIWRSELNKLQKYPNAEIQKRLRPSFDLLDFDQKSIFLDIACSLIGENIDLCVRVLESVNCFADANIDVLVDKSLITITLDDSLQMHELIRSMAREVLREESDRRIRLWGPSDVYSILGENNILTDTAKEVEVLVLSQEKSTKTVHVDCKSFSKMKKLRILKVCYPQPKDFRLSFQLSVSTDISVKFSGSLDFLSNQLRLIYWHGYPFKCLPANFYPENIVAIDLSFSNIKRFWTTPKCFKSLKVMKLRHCRNLKTTPDFTEMVNLEKLILEGCVSLVKLHPSIGMLKKLVKLNMRDCIQIWSFPYKVELDSLQVLILPRCLKMDYSTQESGILDSLMKLYAYGTTITEFQSFISSLTNLQVLEIGRYEQTESPAWWPSIFQKQPQSLVLSSLASLRLLKDLRLRNCNISELCHDIGALSCLDTLDLSGNNFTNLPGSLGQLSRLEDLILNGCKELEVLPELPSNIVRLQASECTSLQEPPRLSHRQRILVWHVQNCPKMSGNVNIDDSQVSMAQTRFMDSDASTNQFLFFVECLGILSNISEFFVGDKQLTLILSGKRRIPRWFTNKSKGSHIKIELPPNWCFSKFKGFGICAVFELKESHRKGCPGFSVNNFDGASVTEFRSKTITGMDEPGFFVLCVFFTRDQGWEKAKNFVTVTFQDTTSIYEVKECGVRLLCDNDDEDLRQQQEEEEASVLSIIQHLSPTSGYLFLNDRGVWTGMYF
uniref:disease resistance protein RPV1-like n=1 Tax=Erigeron canadensis TaxID=72917 RepID=UPI001CB8D090|nr:disease resistance protein RPV1-like [Erigeron canadensis]XP_043627448.1 disease resistance protein RPV1-like [Erigeron canadensis]